jgi:hypothetical protein
MISKLNSGKYRGQIRRKGTSISKTFTRKKDAERCGYMKQRLN